MNAMIGFFSSLRCLEHKTGSYHPERPDRLRAVQRAVRVAGMIESPDPFPEFQLDLGDVERANFHLSEVEATEIDPRWLHEVHPPEYVQRIRRVCAAGGGILDQGDTPVSARSFEAALVAAGGVVQACNAVMRGQMGRAFVATRPPGHHAEPDRPMGFCLFSNVAVAARYLQRAHGVERVAIVDFDVHHGNGTQAAFVSDPSVLFISLHQHPRTIFPGTGFEWEQGEGPGHGFTLNIPMPPGAGDEEFLEAMQKQVIPKVQGFGPQFMLISAGFDGHADDPLAQMHLSERGFEQMTRLLVDCAHKQCDGRLVSVLEGGYNLRALGRSVVHHLIALAEHG